MINNNQQNAINAIAADVYQNARNKGFHDGETAAIELWGKIEAEISAAKGKP